MSPEENKAVLQRAVSCYNNLADRSGYFDLYDASAVVHGYQGVEPGLESIQKFYRTFWAAFPDSHLTIEDMLAEGEKVACRYHFLT